jgi:hypothetical protein
LEIFRSYGNITPSDGYPDSGDGFPGVNAKQSLDEVKSIVSYARKVKEAK